MRRAMLAVAAMSIALTGCELSFDIVVERGGSGTAGFRFGIDKQILALIDDPFREVEGQLPEGVDWSVERYSTAQVDGVEARFPFADVDGVAGTLGAGSGGSARGVFERLAIRRTDEGWRFDATINLSGTERSARELLRGTGVDPQQVIEAFDLAFRVTLPGTVVTSNATTTESRDGATRFVWEPNLTKTTKATLSAQTVAPDAGGFPILPVALGGAGLAAAAWAIARRRAAVAPGRSAPPLPAEPVVDLPPQDQPIGGNGTIPDRRPGPAPDPDFGPDPGSGDV